MQRSMMALIVVAAMTAIGCSDAPVGPGDPDGEMAFTGTVSNPVTATGPASGASSAGEIAGHLVSVEPIAYVSAPPGRFPGATGATVENLRTGAVFSPAVAGGGFDPVDVPAAVGETLAITVTGSTGGPVAAREVVAARRRPRVVRTQPARGRTDVAINATIAVVFSEPIDLASTGGGKVQLRKGGNPVAGIVRALAGSRVGIEFVPGAPLEPGTAYELVLAVDIVDLTGDALAAPVTTPFTTLAAGAPEPQGQLIFTVTPSTAWAREDMPPVTVIVVRDGSIDLGYSGPVTLSLAGGTPGATLLGQTAVDVIAGVARFDDVSVSTEGLGYTLTASSAVTESTVSAPFTVRPGSQWIRQGRGSGGVLATANGIVYQIAGWRIDWNGLPIPGNVFTYDIAAGVLVERGPLRTQRTGHAVGVIGGVIYAVGGSDPTGALASVEAYDPVTGIWTPRASLPTPRHGVSVAVVGGKPYAIGGLDGGSATRVDVYDPVLDSWSPRAPIPTRLFGAVGVIDGIIYAVGSVGATNAVGGAVQAYDPATDTWTSRAPMPTVRQQGVAVAVVDGLLYAIGGELDADGHGIVEIYDPAADSWRPGPWLEGFAGQTPTAVVGRTIYVMQGLVRSYTPAP
jgi:hypothetical protein